jgi:spermidine synthase
LLVAALVVGLSGFCGLVYQVVWERALRYHLGGDSVSAAIVTGTFLLGLGLGAALFGRWRPAAARTYALVEVAVGLYGAVSFHLLAWVASAAQGVFEVDLASAGGLRPAVIVAAVVCLLPPSILIGATAPLMFNTFIGPGRYGARAVGLLYGLNTLGAALGVLAAPFLLLNRLSLPVTLAVVAGINLGLGALIALRGGPRDTASPLPAAPVPREGGPPPAVGLAFLSGLFFLAFEVSLVRALFIQNPSSPYNFPAVLVPLLGAVAVGSVLATRRGAEEPAAIWRRIGWLCVGGSLAMLIAVAISAGLSQAGFRVVVLTPGLQGLALVVHATLLAMSLPLWLGGMLPLLLRLAAPTGRALPSGSGQLYLANAAGAFAGALGTQFLGFPLVGTRGVLTALYFSSLAVGGWCLWRASAMPGPPLPRRSPAGRFALTAALVGLAAGPVLLPPSLWRVYTAGVRGPGAELVEGITGVAMLDWDPGGGDLIVNGQYMSRLPSHPRHVRLVAFALALPHRERVLLLGLGGGGMVRDLARDPAVRHLAVVDWSHELPRLLDGPRARAALADALRDPKVGLCRCDARVAVRAYAPASFDVVVDNLTVGHWVGATSVKSATYFGHVRRLLGPGGVFVYHGNWGGARRAILAGLAQTFPHVQLHPGADRVEEVVLASDAPVSFDRDHVAAVLARLPAGMRGPDELVGRLVPVTPAALGRASPVRDDLLVYEYHLDPTRAVRRVLHNLWRSARLGAAWGGRAGQPGLPASPDQDRAPRFDRSAARS